MIGLLLAIAALPRSESVGIAAVAGHYMEIGGKDGCRLDIEDGGTFELTCLGETPRRGTVEMWGDAVGFGVELSSNAVAESESEALEYRRAARQFIREHRKQHGAYPLLSPRFPWRTSSPPPLVPVHGRDWQYLVDPDERDGFCAATRAGRWPIKVERRFALFRRHDEKSVPAGIPWRRFCEPAWRPRIVFPE